MSSSIAELRTVLERRWQAAIPRPRLECSVPSERSVPGERSELGGLRRLGPLLGPGGIPQGRLIELFGARSSGKTTLTFTVLAACTRAGGIGAYVDPARRFFAPAAAAAGIDMRRLVVVRPHDAAASLRALDALVRGAACAVVAFDASECPGALRAQHCARLVAQAEKTGTTLLIVSAGNEPAVASFAALRLRASGLAPLWQEGSDACGRLLGCTTSIEVAKSRATAPGRNAHFAAALPDVAGTWPLANNVAVVIRPVNALSAGE